MKILLVSPINRTYVIMPSLGLGYLASIARKDGHKVQILDCKMGGMTFEDFETFISGQRHDLFGFQIFSYDINHVKKHIEMIKKHNHKALIVAGGAHPSGDPKGLMKYLEGLDFAFVGESEIGFRKFLALLEERGPLNILKAHSSLKNIPGLIYRGDAGEVFVNPASYVDNLDSLDFPAWDLMDPREYPEAPHGAFARQFPTAPIIITRGCPHSCTFCAGKVITGLKLRKRSIENVWSEVEFLIEKFGVKELLIEDENFSLHKDLLEEFCLKLINTGKKISWSFPAGIRLETLNKKNIKLMEEAGCYSMAVGVEFGSQRIHDLTQKRMSIGVIEDRVALLSKSKIKITGFFLMGIPGETREDIRSTIDLSLRLDLDRAQFNNFMPLPGSQLWNDLVKSNKLTNINWDHFFVHDVAYVSNDISRDELKRLQREAYLKFYLRPKIILNILKEIRSFRHLRMLLKRFIDSLT